eukprot:396022_1
MKVIFNNKYHPVIMANLEPAVGAVLGIICVLICIIVLIDMFRRKLLNSGIHKNVVYFTNGSIGCFLVSLLAYTVSNIMANKEKSNWILVVTLYNIYLLFWTIGQIFIYWLLLLRLYFAFADTNYALSKHYYILFSVLMFIFFICCVSGLIGNILEGQYYYNNNSKIKEQTFYNFFSLYAFGTELTDLLITVLLVTLFIKKLLMVTTDMSANQCDRFVNNESAILNIEQKMLLNVVTKFFILTLFATIATQIDIALATIAFIALRCGSIKGYHIAHYLYWWLRPIDCAINSICLYLLPETSDGNYKKICKGCDAYIRLCCKRITKQRIKKHYGKINHDDLSMQLMQ